jgi:hypothetical protein
MTMHAKIANPVTPVASDDAFGALRPRSVLPATSARRALPPVATRNNPSLVVVVPDPLDAIVAVGGDAGLKGGPKLLWTLGVLLLLAL